MTLGGGVTELPAPLLYPTTMCQSLIANIPLLICDNLHLNYNLYLFMSTSNL